jgi:aldehyde dehydrogenase (NAD+)
MTCDNRQFYFDGAWVHPAESKEFQVINPATEAEAITIANDTPYGLAAYVWPQDNVRARQVGHRIRAGQVALNGASGDMKTLFGGFKMSGNGREFGEFGLRDFLEVKAVIGVDAA